MPTAITAPGQSSPVTSADQNKAFRQADFLKIMLAEVTSQSPFDPQDTGKMVENLQKLQELANTTYAKYRADITWAQQLVGQSVSVQQSPLTAAELQEATEQGLRPDVGYGQVTGPVTSFRTVKEKVWLTVGGKDYPIDNLKQVQPESASTALGSAAAAALGRQVGWIDDAGQPRSGLVREIRQGADGVILRIGDQDVPFARIRSIGLVG